jgi:hypothetical protein
MAGTVGSGGFFRKNSLVVSFGWSESPPTIYFVSVKDHVGVYDSLQITNTFVILSVSEGPLAIVTCHT